MLHDIITIQINACLETIKRARFTTPEVWWGGKVCEGLSHTYLGHTFHVFVCRVMKVKPNIKY